MNEVDVKVERLARIAREQGVGAVLIARQPNFAWLTGGQSNRIDGSVDVGQGSLLVTDRGQRYVVANAIEMPRLREEGLHGLDFEAIEYPWTADHAEADATAAAVQAQLGNLTLGGDVESPLVRDVSAAIVSAQRPLLDAEIARYRALGRDASAALGAFAQTLRPGTPEIEVAAQVNAVMSRRGGRAVVTLVAADERIARFRHPVPTARPWSRALLVGVCVERHGLVVALSRLIHAGRAPRDLIALTAATTQVFDRLLAATREGASGAELFETARAAYREVGYAGQEALHHQGGAIGYRSRDWIAHPASRDRVHDRQAFAWNPSITGSKVEDTALLVDGSLEFITASPEPGIVVV